MTFTGMIGTACMFPLRAIIDVCVLIRIHPNALTFIGVVVNAASAWALGVGEFLIAGVVMVFANIFDFIDGKVAERTNLSSDFGGFWDSVMDRFSDILLFIGLLYLYTEAGRPDYVMITALALMFSVMTSYTRARAESLIAKCKVGFMERPERIVLFMIGAFTNRMAAVLWVILVLSVVTVVDRIYFTWRELRTGPSELHPEVKMTFRRVISLPVLAVWHALFWTFDRATWQYDLMVVAILAFVWITPPELLGDPTALGPGLIGLLRGSGF
jgi:CDP-diacylglycerol--glycerol-3-phosphate 3-phosphatidyltransferase